MLKIVIGFQQCNKNYTFYSKGISIFEQLDFRMNKLFLIISLFVSAFAFSQNEVKWDVAFNRSTKNVELKASIAPGWHLYATDIADGVGPLPTVISFSENSNLMLLQSLTYPKPIVSFDPNFEAEVGFYENEVVFQQGVKVKKNTILKGEIEFMVCNDVTCLPPVVERFEIKMKK